MVSSSNNCCGHNWASPNIALLSAHREAARQGVRPLCFTSPRIRRTDSHAYIFRTNLAITRTALLFQALVLQHSSASASDGASSTHHAPPYCVLKVCACWCSKTPQAHCILPTPFILRHRFNYPYEVYEARTNISRTARWHKVSSSSVLYFMYF